jgi:hypothetical protein
MKKVEYSQQPAKLEPVGNGSHLYRWAIEQVQRPAQEGTEATTIWQCFQVLIWNAPTREKVTEAVIAALWPHTIEAKLVNDYNAAKEGVLSDEYRLTYLHFINERNDVKQEIKAFFDENVQ